MESETIDYFDTPDETDVKRIFGLPDKANAVAEKCRKAQKTAIQSEQNDAFSQLQNFSNECQWALGWIQRRINNCPVISTDTKCTYLKQWQDFIVRINDWIDSVLHPKDGKTNIVIEYNNLESIRDGLFGQLHIFLQKEAEEPQSDLASTKRNAKKIKSQNLIPISQLIAQGEDHTLEFKETLEYSVRDKKQDTNLNKECLKTIAGFLNTDGGTLLIGVRDNGEITGIERDLPYVQRKNEDGFQLKLRDLIKSNFTPFPAGKINIRFEKLTKGTVCRVDVEPVNKDQTIHLGKDVYIREGNSTQKLEGPNLTNWIHQRGK
jgi:hypothetical protein